MRILVLGGGFAGVTTVRELDRVPCDVCQHDIPIAEVVAAEVTDYVVYFCGLDCYDRWRRQREAIHSLLRRA